MVKGIIHILKEDAGVQAWVGRNKADSKFKVYPVVCAQPELYPYQVVRQTGKIPIECKGIAPNAYEYSYEVLSFHKSYEETESLDLAGVAALSKPDGGTYNSVVFQDIRHVNTRDDSVQAEGYSLYCKISSFQAMVNEG